MAEARSLSIRSVSKSYVSGQMAVNDISLDVGAGEFVSFLGPSGSGKTTTLMMIAGFEAPTTGDILIGGRKIDQVAPYQRNIGMVFQNYALFPHMTAAENVAFPLKMRRLARAEMETRTVNALTKVGLNALGGRKPGELSGGQQQRVALARALVFEPDLVLMDEPLGALDKALREQMQIEIKRIHRELGITMIYVTHDQTEAMTMSDRIAVFSHGRIEQVGTPREVYFTPATRFVASFVGDSNLLTGTLADGAVEIDRIGRFPARAAQPERRTVTVLVRPETIRVMSAGTGDVDMTVGETVNFGESLLIVGDASGVQLRVRVPVVDMPEVNHGARVGLSFRPDRFHIVPT